MWGGRRRCWHGGVGAAAVRGRWSGALSGEEARELACAGVRLGAHGRRG
jgi:hypothetical protein